MRAGKLDKTIKLQRAAVTVGAAGQQNTAWSNLAVMRAQVIQASAEEFIRAFGASEETIIAFRIRWIDGITVADRVIFNGTIHDIKELKEIGRRRGLEIRCHSTGVPDPWLLSGGTWNDSGSWDDNANWNDGP